MDNDTDEPMPPASSKRAKPTKVQKDAKCAAVPAANVAPKKGKAAVVEQAAAIQPQGGSDATAGPVSGKGCAAGRYPCVLSMEM